jgi:hypothetical protein
MLNTMLATALGASPGVVALVGSGELRMPAKKVIETSISGNVFAIDPFIYCEPNRHFIPVTEQQSATMRRALERSSELIDQGFIAD